MQSSILHRIVFRLDLVFIRQKCINHIFYSINTLDIFGSKMKGNKIVIKTKPFWLIYIKAVLWVRTFRPLAYQKLYTIKQKMVLVHHDFQSFSVCDMSFKFLITMILQDAENALDLNTLPTLGKLSSPFDRFNNTQCCRSF